MTHIELRPFQVVIWGGKDRLSDDPALRLHFDTAQEAFAALDTHQNSGRYRSGMLMQWDKDSGIWTLVAQFS